MRPACICAAQLRFVADPLAYWLIPTGCGSTVAATPATSSYCPLAERAGVDFWIRPGPIVDLGTRDEQISPYGHLKERPPFELKRRATTEERLRPGGVFVLNSVNSFWQIPDTGMVDQRLDGCTGARVRAGVVVQPESYMIDGPRLARSGGV
jgi:hypothetical protein